MIRVRAYLPVMGLNTTDLGPSAAPRATAALPVTMSYPVTMSGREEALEDSWWWRCNDG